MELQIINLAFDCLSQLSGLVQDQNYLMRLVLDYLLQLDCSLVMEFLLKVYLDDNVKLEWKFKVISLLFIKSNMKIKESIAESLVDHISNFAIDRFFDLLPALFSCRPMTHGKGSKENAFCWKMIQRFHHVNPLQILPYLAPLQSFHVIDHSIIVSIVDLCVSQMSREDVIFFWIRGLLARQESFRALSATKLEGFIGSIPRDLFVIPSGYAQQANNFSSGSISTAVAVKLIQTFNEERGPKLMEALSVLRLGLHDMKTRSILMDLNLLSNLMLLLETQVLNLGEENQKSKNDIQDDIPSDLLACLRILVQFDFSPESRSKLLFRKDVLLSLFSRLVYCSEKTRFEGARLFVLLLFEPPTDHGTFSEQHIDAPLCVIDAFFVFGLAGNSMPIRLEENEFSQFSSTLWEGFSKMMNTSYHKVALLESLKELKGASTVSDFTSALDYVNRLTFVKDYGMFFVFEGLLQILSRFFTVNPASEEDGIILAQVLQVLRDLPMSEALEEQLALGWEVLLQVGSSKLSNISQDLSDQIGGIMANLVCKARPTLYEKLKSKCEPIQNIISFIQVEPSQAHYFQILLRFVVTSNFLMNCESSLLNELIQVLVITSSSAIRPHSNYRIQKASYLALVLLRTITSLAVTKVKKNIWGPVWLLKNEITWIKDLLNHEDDDMQIAAIGLITNLILYDDAFVLICDTIPYFIDSSTSIVLNSSELPEKRKEALLLISVFFHSLKMRSQPTEGPEGELIPDQTWKRNGFHIVENIFPKLSDLISSPYYPLRLAAMTIIFNLCCANKYLMKKVLQEHSVFDALFDSAKFQLVNGRQTSLDKKCVEITQQTHVQFKEEFLILSLHVMSLLIEADREFVDYLIRSTDFQSYLLLCLQFEFTSSEKEKFALSICTMLSIVLQNYDVSDRQVFQPLFGSFLFKVLFLTLECIQKDDVSSRSAGYTLLSQILSWKFSIGKESSVEKALLGQDLGQKLTSTLINRLFSPLAEVAEILSIENCLNHLLGAFVSCKELALRAAFFKKLEKRLSVVVISNSKPDASKSSRINSMIYLVTNICANYSPGKVTACTSGYLSILATIIASDSYYGACQSSALSSIRAMISNSDSNALKICCSFSSNQFGLSLVDVLIAHISHSAISPATFSSLVETFKVLVVHKESRNVLIKVCVGFLTNYRRAFFQVF